MQDRTASMLATLASPCRIKRNHRSRRTIASGRRDYNYFRDYDSSTGRYVESDPIGILADVGTYTYAYDSPVEWFDPYGRAPVSRNFSPGGGGNASDRRSAARAFQRSGSGEPVEGLKQGETNEGPPRSGGGDPESRRLVMQARHLPQEQRTCAVQAPDYVGAACLQHAGSRPKIIVNEATSPGITMAVFGRSHRE